MTTDGIDELDRARLARVAAEEPPWPALTALPEPGLPTVPTLDPSLLPTSLRGWLVDAAARLDVPLELVATPALSLLGGLLGRRVVIAPKQHDDWVVVANLWAMIVARPGFLKSPAMAEAQRFLKRLDAQATSAFLANERERAVQRECLETRIAQLKRAAQQKTGQPAAMQEELCALRDELARLTVAPVRYYANDSTVEKLADLLTHNPAGLCVLRDELAGFLRLLDKPGREGDREFYLEAWNGTGDFRVDRIGRGSLYLPALTLAICGTVQPDKLDAYIADALAGGRGGDGLLQRFQLIAWPDFPEQWTLADREPDADARTRAWHIFEAIAGWPVESTLRVVRFSPDAARMVRAWRDAHEERLRSTELDDCPAYESHVAKYRSLLPALALLTHVAEHARASVTSVLHSVDVATTLRANSLVEFFDAHARRVYAVELQGGRLPHVALARHIRAGEVRDRDPVRALYRRQWRLLGTREAVEGALDALAALGWVRLEDVPTGGRKSRVVRLHPALREPGPQRLGARHAR